MHNKVAITGLGSVSALGIGHDNMLRGVMDGQTALRAPATKVSDGPGLIAAIPDFSVVPFLKSRKAYLDRSSELALAAAALALSDSGFDGERDVGDIGLLLGTARGNTATMELYYAGVLDKGPAGAKPVLFPHLYPNTAAGLTAIEFNLGGMHAVYAGGWISGAAALLQGTDWIAAGNAAALLAGGVDALHPLVMDEFWKAGRLSPRSGPAGGHEGVFSFDRRANGVVLGEGAGLVILESESHAVGRGAVVQAELAGGAMGSVASATEALSIMRRALERSGCGVDDIGWVCAHGSGDPILDAWEGGALDALAKERVHSLTVWTAAPQLGETLAAGSGLRLALAVGLMGGGRFPPTSGPALTSSQWNRIVFPPTSGASSAGPVLVNTIDPGGSLVALVVKPWLRAGKP